MGSISCFNFQRKAQAEVALTAAVRIADASWREGLPVELTTDMLMAGCAPARLDSTSETLVTG